MNESLKPLNNSKGFLNFKEKLIRDMEKLIKEEAKEVKEFILKYIKLENTLPEKILKNFRVGVINLIRE